MLTRRTRTTSLAAAAFVLLACAFSVTTNINSVGQTLEGSLLEDLWVFARGGPGRHLHNAEGVGFIKGLVQTASLNGYNGLVLSSFGLDGIINWDDEDFAMLEEVRKACSDGGLELIPAMFSVADDPVAMDPSRAAALPTFVHLEARDGRLWPAEGLSTVSNGDFENFDLDRNRFDDFTQTKPGQVSFVDQTTGRGSSSIRFTDFHNDTQSRGLVGQWVAVEPWRNYRLAFSIRTDQLEPAGSLKVKLYDREQLNTAHHNLQVAATADWAEVTINYYNRGAEEVYVQIGLWGAEAPSGTFWLDEIRFAEFDDLGRIVRREGTPLRLQSEQSSVAYVEGFDYDRIEYLEPGLAYVELPACSPISEGETLRLSCYKASSIITSKDRLQHNACMSNPDLYDHWRETAQALHEAFRFKTVLVNASEIRNGGGCAACQSSGKTYGEILSQSICMQQAIFKELDEEIRVIVWSDLFDPHHNAALDHQGEPGRSYYKIVGPGYGQGTYHGSWEGLPEDVTIMNWRADIPSTPEDELALSLNHFDSLGFDILGAIYFRWLETELQETENLLELLACTPHATGIMYTTWRDDYEHLAEFAKLVSEFTP